MIDAKPAVQCSETAAVAYTWTHDSDCTYSALNLSFATDPCKIKQSR